MGRSEFLGEFESVVLLAIARLGEGAYGTTIRREIETRTGRFIAVGALYTTLDRLERRGLLASWVTDPTPQRGGRSKRCFRLAADGVAALRRSRRMMDRMWDGAPELDRGGA